MGALRLTFLGGFEARLASGGAVRLSTKKAQALLAYLGLPPGQAHQRDKLAALLWGERSDEHARDGLRHALVTLRNALSRVTPPSVLVEGHTLALNPAVVEVDVATFERQVTEGTPEALEQAAELYRGDLLLGFSVNEALFEDWLMAERERLREVAIEALARLLAHQTRQGGTERAIQTAVRLLALDPLQEPVHRALMRLYQRQGRRGAALKQYRLCLGVLQRELGTEPEAETKQLYQELLQRSAGGPMGLGSSRARSREPDPENARLDLPIPEVPLVGRDAELAVLGQAVDQASRGEGRIAVVIGEAGIGKSALLGALAAHTLARSTAILVGRAHESDRILAFGPWVQALRAGKELLDDLFATLEPVWRAEVARLLPEFDAPGPPPASGSDLRLFEGVTRVIERLTERGPLMLVLEDLHWADEMSLRLLAFVGRRLHHWRVLVVVTAREEELAEAPMARRTLEKVGREGLAIRLGLSPLSRSDTLRLVRNLAGPGSEVPGPGEVEDTVWRVSEGNPLVAVEMMRALQQGAVVLEPTALPLPERVRDLVAGRLERVSERGRQLAAVAAVIGREFEFRLLQRASGLAEEATAKGVEELVRRRVLQGVGEGFDFTHDRIRAVVDGQLLAPRRKLLHRRVGEAIEELHAGHLELPSLALGVHFRQGEAWEKAASHMWRAGTQAAARSAYRQAVAAFEEALAALGHLAETRETLAQAVDLHLEARQVLYPLGEIEAIFGHLQTAEAVSLSLGDQRRLAAVLANLTQYFWQVGELVRGLETGQRAVAIADAIDDLGLRVAARQYLGQVYLDRGAFRDAEAVFARHAGELEGDRIRQRFGMAGYPAVFQRFLLGYCHAELGEVIDGVALGEQALRIAEEIDQPYTCALACLWLGRIHLVQGDIARASRVLEPGLDIAEAHQLGIPVLVAALGYARAMSGHLPSGLPLLETAEALLREAKSGRLALVSGWLGEAYLVAGRLTDGIDTAQRALALARHHHQRGTEAWTLRLLGEIAVHGNPPDAAGAKESYRRALALAEELGMRPLAARCHLGLGRLYRQTAERVAGAEHLVTARTMLADMGMRVWLEQTEAKLKGELSEPAGA